ncbi:MAG: radical SAM protein, partial [Bacteroidia bacterium]|nr:radical SAM protein [Bacteroidia bacterium]
MDKIIIFNPRSANAKHRLPNTILQVAASIHNRFEYVLVDGNMEKNPWETIENYIKTGEFGYFGCTAMPGPQLKEAIPITISIKEKYPYMKTIWGGYFASNQYKSVITSGYVDFIVDGPGDIAFPKLMDALSRKETTFDTIESLIYMKEGEIIKTKKGEIPDYNILPQLPYESLDKFYPLTRYLGKTFLGNRTMTYHSSFGCPFTCSFCAVVPIYNARWKGKKANLIYEDIKWLKDKYGADSLEFHDNNFFVSEKRTVEFSKLVQKENIQW